MGNLFRKQVSAKKPEYLGSHLNARILSWKELFLLLSITGILIVIFLFYISFNDKINLNGVIVSHNGESELVSPISGTVIYINNSSKKVKKGDPLFKISIAPINEEIESYTNEKISKLNNQLEQLKHKHQGEKDGISNKKTSINDKIFSLKSENNSLTQNETLVRKKLQLSKDNLNLLTQASDRGIISKLPIHDREQQVLDLEIKINSLINQKAKNLTLINELKSTVEFLPQELHKLFYEYNKDLNSLTEKISDLELQRIRTINSPINGYLSSVSIKENETVDLSQVLGVISSETRKYEVFLPLKGSVSGKVKIGAPVKMNLPSFPYQDFGFINGKIHYISQYPISDLELKKYNIPKLSEMSYYKSIATINENDLKKSNLTSNIQSGMPIKVEIILNRNNLIQKILNPIRKTSKKMIVEKQ